MNDISQPNDDATEKQKRPAWRWVVDALLLLHLMAVFFPPFTFISSSPESVSPAARLVMDVLRPYSDAAYLNHGYAFFAPDPGPSHLVRYKVEFDDDSKPPIEKTFPDIERHWPRLLY